MAKKIVIIGAGPGGLTAGGKDPRRERDGKGGGWQMVRRFAASR